MSWHEWLSVVSVILALYAAVMIAGHMYWHSKTPKERRRSLEEEYETLNRSSDGNVIPFELEDE